MKAIQFIRSVPRWLLVRLLGPHLNGLASGALSCIRLTDVEPPALPAPDWVRIRPHLSGICGSDLSAIACKGSPYFAPFVSTPFIPGHELVGTIEEVGASTPGEWPKGSRIVVEPGLGCLVRGIEPPCACCQRGAYVHCMNILEGHIAGGIQTGYCRSTGGGWSHSLVAHPSQLHRVPDSMDDELAVLVEPFACSLHGAMKVSRSVDTQVLVMGCGSIGLMAIAAYRAIGGQGKLFASARYSHQAEMAREMGADEVCTEGSTEKFYRWVLERTGGTLHQPELGKPVPLGGVPVILDCVGSSASLDDAIRLAAPLGQIVLVGMPGIPKGVDWTGLWYKELRLQGAYAYGWEDQSISEGEEEGTGRGAQAKTFHVAISLLGGKIGPRIKALVRKKYPLEQYREALDEAFNAGRKKAFKVVFEIGK